VSNGYLTSTRVYYNTGEINTSTDPCGNTTTYSYANEGNGYNASTCSTTYYYGGYLTSVANTLAQTTYYCYDFNTGAPTTIQDPNLQTTTKGYDILGRLTSVNYPDGGSSSYCYSDMPSSLGGTCPSGPPFQVIETKPLYSTTLSETRTGVVDGLGRLSQAQLNSDPTGADYTLTTYDGLGRKSVVYNPTRCSTITSNCKTETTWGFTTTNYDALSRVTSVVEQDGSTVSITYGTTPPSGYTGYCTTATDEVGNSHQSCVDGLGRMTSVVEDPGSSPHLNYLTVYGYNALGDLTGVTQYGSSSSNARVRSFAYNSLSHLTSATNPESGTITYAYDADGNAITKTALSPNQANAGTATVVTTSTYDKLNRLTGKSYVDGYKSNPMTASVSYGYDGVAPSGCTPPTVVSPFDSGIPITPTNTIGRRSSMCDASGATAWIYDSMGRPTIEQRMLNGITKNIGYTYYLDGHQHYVRYASDDAIGYGITAAGRLYGVEGFTDNFVYNNAGFAPGGQVTSMSQYVQSGSFIVGFSSAFAYNSRLQPELAYAGYNGTELYERCYNYHQTQSVTYGGLTCSATATSPADNGNVYQISNLLTSARSQSFTYDSLNRVSQAYSTGPNWGQAFTLDAWGNLTAVSAISGKTLVGGFTATASTKNQLSCTAGCSSSYDAAGNMLTDGNGAITYDDENRILTAGGVTYTYDGDGKRVEKSSGTLYWTGVGSDVLSESDLSGNLNEEYIYFYGMRVSRIDIPSDTVHGFLLDHLNSSRMSVVPSGTNTLTVEDDLDYTPYGIVAYGTPSDPFQFTGKERDTESGLDNFGARYNASTMGRFMSPDPSNASVDFWLPQTWNRYSYALNNPLQFVDRNGLWPTSIHTEIINQAFPGLSQGDRTVLVEASYDTDYTNKVNGHDPQDPEVSFVHGMSDGVHNQDPAEAQAEGDAFIAQNEHDAQQIQAEWEAEGNTGIAPAALTAFGNALHTIEDRTSPAHVGNQPWYGTKGLKNKYRALQHVRREATINNAQMRASVAAAQQAFRQTFGDEFEWLAIQQRPEACVEVDDGLGNHSKSCD
jgi:RHS repeat-associated protein